MNRIIYKDKIYNYINYYHDGVDSFGDKFPKPVKSNKKINKSKKSHVINNLKILQKMSKYKKAKKSYPCKICGKKNIMNGIFTFKKNVWQDSLIHYFEEHSVSLQNTFMQYASTLHRTGVSKYKYDGTHHIILTRNQLNILDALLFSGGDKNIYEIKHNFYFSEHFGLLDFNKKKLKTILIDANTTRIDAQDNTILLPTIVRDDIDDYEYIFHTHPLENGIPGGRAKDGILYEFPSVSDINHFIALTFTGIVNGSIVNTAEGLYIIKKRYFSKPLKILDPTEEENLNELIDKEQYKAIKKYGTNSDTNKFYNVIAKDTKFTQNINNKLKKYNIYVTYYNRIKNKRNKWVLPDIKLKVDVFEEKK